MADLTFTQALRELQPTPGRRGAFYGRLTRHSFSREPYVTHCSYCRDDQEMYRVFSYETCIGQRCMTCRHLWVDTTTYSRQTTFHQRLLANAWELEVVPDKDKTIRSNKRHAGDISLTYGPYYKGENP